MDKRPILTSASNPHIKKALKLRNKRERDRTQRFLIEGYRELSLAARASVFIEELFFSPSHFLGDNENELIRIIEQKGSVACEIAPHLFDKLSYRDRGDGLIAVAKQTHFGLADLDALLEKNSHPFLLVAEAIEKPGNLGSILRSADAAGVDALILSDRCTDIHNPNVVRASIGTLFTVPVIEASSLDVMDKLREKGIQMVAATPSATTLFTEAPLRGATAIAVGREQVGLSEAWLKRADLSVKIPMHGRCDSLNVAAATTLLLYEVVRQRQ